MRAKRTNFQNVRSETVIMDGGLNENVSSLELKGGELTLCRNYQLAEGSYGGYVSIKGYERYDGQTKPSSVSATSSDDTAREAARSAIDPVGDATDACQGAVLGLTIFDGKVYAFRRKVNTPSQVGMYVESGSGWTEINTSGDPISYDSSQEFNFFVYNFSGTTGGLEVLWTDGYNKARRFDGTTVNTITNGGMGADDKPINLAVHSDRLFLAYAEGSLQYSNVGDPTDWSTGSGEIGIGREITDLITGVGNALIIFCDEAIRILNGTSVDEWYLETFSDVSGAYKRTANRLLGTVFFMDDRGVTSLSSVDAFGDFASNNISQKIYRTLQNSKSFVTCATVSRDLNQFRLFFSDSTGAYFSFKDKELRGVTLVDFTDPVYIIAEGEDSSGTNMIFFAGSDGYVYQMDSGTSFDGEEISTILETSFYHYKSPSKWKNFKSITFEVFSSDSLSIDMRAQFDYNSDRVPSSTTTTKDLTGTGQTWGTEDWGTLVYAGTGSVTNRLIYHLRGIGSNMRVSMRNTSKYNTQHTIQNFVTDYTLGRRQL